MPSSLQEYCEKDVGTRKAGCYHGGMQAWRHPELREGEVFLSNILPDEMHFLRPWKTARTGTVAFDVYGKKIARKGILPVFVDTAEFAKRYGVSSLKRL